MDVDAVMERVRPDLIAALRFGGSLEPGIPLSRQERSLIEIFRLLLKTVVEELEK
jgi:hypothetical protein